MSLKDEDEMLAKQREELKKHSADKEDSKPVPIAKDSGFIRKKTNLNPAPQVGGGNSGQYRTSSDFLLFIFFYSCGNHTG